MNCPRLGHRLLIAFFALVGVIWHPNMATAFDPFDPLGLAESSRNLAGGADRLGKVVVDESGKWRVEVNEVKKSLDRLPAEVKDQFSPMLERTLKSAGTEARATIQFTAERMRQNAKAILALKLLAEKGAKPEDIKEALKALGEALTPPEPSLIGSEAGQVEVEYTTPLDFQAKRTALILHGYDFRQAGGDGVTWKVEVLNKDKQVLRDESAHLAVSSGYEMTVNTSAKGIKFKPGDHSLRISWGPKVVSVVPITWGDPLDSLKKFKPEVYTVRTNGRKSYIYDCGHFYWFESELGVKGHVMKNAIKTTPKGGEFSFEGNAARFEPSGAISWNGGQNEWIPAK